MERFIFRLSTVGMGVIVWLLVACTYSSNEKRSNVTVVGAMRNAMWKGEISGIIYLDTLHDKEHLYGLGPLENLRGELMILDGKSYKSQVVTDTSMHVLETFDVRAPFFSYARIEEWKQHVLPDSVRTIAQLEQYLSATTQGQKQAFLFRVTGRVERAVVHVVNLPKGSTVRSPTEAHRGQVNYTLENQAVEILGFYSTRHKAVFTHHDTNVHMHLMTTDHQVMGHLDKVSLVRGSAVLHLPTL